MFDKMVKMRNRKGFSLVEMLIVIAVIAILTGIIVPVVGHSVQKSRAATNAANLRAVEGQISTLRLEKPGLFEDAVENMGIPLTDNISLDLNIIARLFGYEDMSSFLENDSDNVLAQYASYKLYHTTATHDEKLLLSGGGDSYTLENVPAAVGVSVGGDPEGMEVEEGTPMTVYISSKGIVATYECGGHAYTKEDFAQVAETGKFDGTASGGMSQEALEENNAIAATEALTKKMLQEAACAAGNHEAGKDCKCVYCGEVAHYGGFTDAGDSGHTCKACNMSNIEHDWKDGKCTSCGRLCEHVWAEATIGHSCNTCKKNEDHDYSDGTGICADCGKECGHSWSDGKCRLCGKICSDHAWTDYAGNKTEHICSICRTRGDHEFDSTYSCKTCGTACEHDWSGSTCGLCGKTCGHSWTLVTVNSLPGHSCGLCGSEGNHDGLSSCSVCEAKVVTEYSCSKYVFEKSEEEKTLSWSGIVTTTVNYCKCTHKESYHSSDGTGHCAVCSSTTSWKLTN